MWLKRRSRMSVNGSRDRIDFHQHQSRLITITEKNSRRKNLTKIKGKMKKKKSRLIELFSIECSVVCATHDELLWDRVQLQRSIKHREDLDYNWNINQSKLTFSTELSLFSNSTKLTPIKLNAIIFFRYIKSSILTMKWKCSKTENREIVFWYRNKKLIGKMHQQPRL